MLGSCFGLHHEAMMYKLIKYLSQYVYKIDIIIIFLLYFTQLNLKVVSNQIVGNIIKTDLDLNFLIYECQQEKCV